jgi:hypothetical protein
MPLVATIETSSAAFFLPPKCKAKAMTNAMTKMMGVIESLVLTADLAAERTSPLAGWVRLLPFGFRNQILERFHRFTAAFPLALRSHR